MVYLIDEAFELLFGVVGLLTVFMLDGCTTLFGFYAAVLGFDTSFGFQGLALDMRLTFHQILTLHNFFLDPVLRLDPCGFMVSIDLLLNLQGVNVGVKRSNGTNPKLAVVVDPQVELIIILEMNLAIFNHELISDQKILPFLIQKGLFEIFFLLLFQPLLNFTEPFLILIKFFIFIQQVTGVQQLLLLLLGFPHLLGHLQLVLPPGPILYYLFLFIFPCLIQFLILKPLKELFVLYGCFLNYYSSPHPSSGTSLELYLYGVQNFEVTKIFTISIRRRIQSGGVHF